MKIRDKAAPAGPMERRHDTLDNPLRGPRASLSTRKISRKSNPPRRGKVALNTSASGRAVILAIDPNGQTRQILCESILEAKFAWVALADRRVIHLREQPPALTYVDEDGRKRKHTFDFALTLNDGRIVYYEVRTAKRVHKVEPIVEAIRQQSKGVAHGFAIVSEAALPSWKVQNAQLVLACRHDRDQAADAAVRAVVANITTPVCISQIVTATGLGGAAFRAVVRLIDHGELSIANARIAWDAHVSLSNKEAA